VRRRLTEQQPYRCHQCGWREWRRIELAPANPDVRPDDLRTGRQPKPVNGSELDPLDPKSPE
jgi:hypothetical protein